MVALRGIYYVGNHGLEIEGPGAKFRKRDFTISRPELAEICRNLKEALHGIKGVTVEDKGLTASVHFRMVKKEELKRMKTIFWRTIGPHARKGMIRITGGKMVFEIRPKVDWDKGKAAAWLIELLDPDGDLIPVYIGDDSTYEDAFLALKEKGITILVAKRPRKSNAKFFLRGVDEVKIFLGRLVD